MTRLQASQIPNCPTEKHTLRTVSDKVLKEWKKLADTVEHFYGDTCKPAALYLRRLISNYFYENGELEELPWLRKLAIEAMAISTWAAKTKKQGDETEASPSKVLCTSYERSLKKMEGDLTLMKEILSCVNSYKGDWKVGQKLYHPGQAILDQLAGDNEGVNVMNAKSLQSWYEDYCKHRAAMGVTLNFKDVLDASSDGDIVKVRLNLDEVQCSWMNMVLSHRGAERQPPNVLQQALRFSGVMEIRSTAGDHAKELNTEQRLRKVIEEYESSPGFNAKWSLDETRIQSILNVICGTATETRALMREHLHKNKWSQSALNAELMRRPRWLLGAVVKGCPDSWKQVLTVTPQAQALFMQLVFAQFHEKITKNKVRPHQRGRCRLAGTEWDNYVSFSCVYASAIQSADLLSAKQANCMENLNKAFMAL
eukprot:s3891_g8.t1